MIWPHLVTLITPTSVTGSKTYQEGQFYSIILCWGRQTPDTELQNSPGFTEFIICQMLGQVWLKVLGLIKMQFCQFLHDKKAGLELTLQTDWVHICVTLNMLDRCYCSVWKVRVSSLAIGKCNVWQSVCGTIGQIIKLFAFFAQVKSF